jgi:hypothetical protein
MLENRSPCKYIARTFPEWRRRCKDMLCKQPRSCRRSLKSLLKNRSRLLCIQCRARNLAPSVGGKGQSRGWRRRALRGYASVLPRTLLCQGICKFTYEFGGSDHDKRPQVRLSGLVNTCLRAVTAAESHTASSIQLLYSL